MTINLKDIASEDASYLVVNEIFNLNLWWQFSIGLTLFASWSIYTIYFFMPRPSKNKVIPPFEVILYWVFATIKTFSLYDDYRFLINAFYKNFILIWIHIATNLIEIVYVAVSVYIIPRQEFDILIDKHLESSTWIYLRNKTIFIV